VLCLDRLLLAGAGTSLVALFSIWIVFLVLLFAFKFVQKTPALRDRIPQGIRDCFSSEPRPTNRVELRDESDMALDDSKASSPQDQELS